MVTLQKIGDSMNRPVLEISGLSTDEKPIKYIGNTYIANGSKFEEIDTGNTYKYDEDAKEWIEQPKSGGASGEISLDYGALTNKPQIGGKELDGNKTLDELGIQPKGNYLTGDSLEEYTKTADADKKYALKTELTKQGVAVADAGDADVKDKLNALLASLRTAGIIAQ